MGGETCNITFQLVCNAVVVDPVWRNRIFFHKERSFFLSFFVAGGTEFNASFTEQVAVPHQASEEPCLSSCTWYLMSVEQIF